MKNLFPEQEARITLWDRCCDDTGRIVREKEYYAAYLKAKGDPAAQKQMKEANR